MPRISERDPQAPRGALLVVSVFGAFVVLGWMLFYFELFLPRVTP